MRFVLAILCSVFALSAAAETVRIRASEDGRSTRLVIAFKERPGWSVQKRGVGYRVHFASVAPIEFDLSRIFQDVSRDRLADARAIGNNTLEIELACRCDVSPSEAGEAALVLDIHTIVRRPADMSVASPILYPPDPTETAKVLPFRERQSFSVPSMPSRPGLLPLPAAPDPITLHAPRAIGSAFGQRPEMSDAAIDMLAHALARAASQGLVDAALEAARQHGSSPTQLPDRPDPRGNLSVATGFDGAIPSDLAAIPPTPSGRTCIPNQQIDVASWGEVDAAPLLGRLRTEAIAEDGSVTSKGASALARYYIFLGFGAEAKNASAFMRTSRDREIIRALADIMDRGKSAADVLRGQVGCEGLVSLWALLALPPDLSLVPESTDDALAAFSALPPHLRTHLGPLLSERLHDAGLPEKARTAINAVTRGGTRTEESRLAQARLDLGGTHAPVARDVLADLSNGTSVTAAGALLELLADAEMRGMAPNPSWVEDVPSLVGALEGTEIAERLNIAGLKGLIALGRYDEFRQEIAGSSPGLTPALRKELAVKAVEAALRAGDDQQFLKTEIALSTLVRTVDLPRASRREIAERLNAIGLSTRSAAYIEGSPETFEELVTTVRVMTRNGAERAAVELVRGVEMEAKEAVLAEALVAAGDDRGAIAAYEKAGQIDHARAAAVRTGSWTWIAENGEDRLAVAARELLKPAEAQPAGDPGENAALIAATRARREEMRALLSFSLAGDSEDAFTN